MPRKPVLKVEGYSDEVAATLMGVTRRTLLRYLKEGKISPPNRMMGINRRAWRDEDVASARMALRERRRRRAS